VRGSSNFVVLAIEDLEASDDSVFCAHGDAAWPVSWAQLWDHDVVATHEVLKLSSLDFRFDFLAGWHSEEPRCGFGNGSSVRGFDTKPLPERVIQVEVKLLVGPLNDLSFEGGDGFGMLECQ